MLWIILLFICDYVSSESAEKTAKEDLTEAEAKDGLEIIKTIKKINDDGSYTIGYEADDGSFKIESRDVLGNVKGTYGYLDEDGEIKRVSYSTNNLTDSLSETSVVQRIPKTNKTFSSTRKPSTIHYSLTTTSPPTSTSVIQTIPKKRVTTQSTTTSTTTTTTTTQKPNRAIYNSEATRSTTSRPANIIYATPVPPRHLLYHQRPLLRSTVAPHVEIQKSEGQILRPEIVSNRPTDLPIFRRLSLRNGLLDNESATIKPVSEEPEIRGNLLRRQLSQEKTSPFESRQHIANLHQGISDDHVDVYSASLTTGTPRPLFTTTSRPRTLPPRYHNNPQTTTEYAQESANTEITVTNDNNPTPLPPRQDSTQQPLVAIRHPFHGGIVLVPLNNIRFQPEQPPQYYLQNGQYYKQPATSPTPILPRGQSAQPIYVNRSPVLRSIPVQVDDNGYVRPIPQQIATPTPYPTPYPIPIPITPPPSPQSGDEDDGVENEVENIRPPVSTRDFQRIIELLILRQKKLERVNALLNAQRQREQLFQQRFSTPGPILLRRPQEIAQNGPVTFVPEEQIPRSRPFDNLAQMQTVQPQEYIIRPRLQENRDIYVQDMYTPAPTSFTPTKRVARLLPSNPPADNELNEDYLPPQIREMLLLRMLQLAINPALPVENAENEEVEDSTPAEQNLKRAGVRNVEVLGEEVDEPKRPSRSKTSRGNAKRF